MGRRRKVVSEKYSELISRINKLRDEAKAAAQEAVTEGLGELFKKYDGLKSIAWRQYTPYFCDGDPCEFSAGVSEYELMINGVSSDRSYDELDEDEEEGAEPLSEKLRDEIAAGAAELLQALEQRDLQDIYGDHVTVKIQRDGQVILENYEHD